ncbi:SSI family serine proteinase inhibitor [Streptomyces sp. NPDC001941]|uniref:SSI family serine proteinase inhibitor n=1 Tax=Streptomyces sp. NPDC001941 TaxID=3154659 RepID=UPI00333404F6
MPHRLVLAAAASLAVLGAAAGTATAVGAGDSGPLPLPLLSPLSPLSPPDSLTVTVADSRTPGGDGTWTLTCGTPVEGSHPAARGACDRLEQLAAEGRDPFAPVPPQQLCTQQYGGPATARVTGTWQGRSVDARFSRTDGCEIGRWNNLAPLLPRTGA